MQLANFRNSVTGKQRQKIARDETMRWIVRD